VFSGELFHLSQLVCTAAAAAEAEAKCAASTESLAGADVGGSVLLLGLAVPCMQEPHRLTSGWCSIRLLEDKWLEAVKQVSSTEPCAGHSAQSRGVHAQPARCHSQQQLQSMARHGHNRQCACLTLLCIWVADVQLLACMHFRQWQSVPQW
jgi:hypothetical protein